jgi:hypothetical protein
MGALMEGGGMLTVLREIDFGVLDIIAITTIDLSGVATYLIYLPNTRFKWRQIGIVSSGSVQIASNYSGLEPRSIGFPHQGQAALLQQ